MIAHKNRELKRGDIVKRSVQGAKGFFYPDVGGSSIMIREDCVAVPQTGWGNYGSYSAYHVSSKAFAEKDRYDNITDKMVVWVKNG